MMHTKRIQRTPRASMPGRRLGTGWLAFLFATLVAFTAQSVVAGTHRHVEWDSMVSATAGDATVKASPGLGGPIDSPADCPICRELAHSGSYLLPAAVAVEAPMPRDDWQVAAIVSWPHLSQPPLGWRSRAPPLHLQA